eukprot:scaffold135693_cov29-Attheya_sp.AAC.1
MSSPGLWLEERESFFLGYRFPKSRFSASSRPVPAVAPPVVVFVPLFREGTSSRWSASLVKILGASKVWGPAGAL